MLVEVLRKIATARVGLSPAFASLAETGEGLRLARLAVAGKPSRDGFVCASDLIAMSALRVLYETGRAVPDDAQIVGFDDLPMAAQTMPPLTTIRQEIAEGARVMVERLKARIEGESTESLAMAPSLIVRRTTRR